MTTASILTLIALFLIVVAVAFYVVYWPQLRLNRIYHQQFPAQWLEILHRRLPFYQNLPEKLQQQLQNQVKVFLNDKSFVGCGGQEINDEIRVTIAAQACLLLLNKKSSHYDKLQSILVYPSTFVTTRQVRDDLGLVSTNRAALLGESWSQGKVILAWDNVENGVLNLQDGHNVVLHEFAHQLDHESGATNGAPMLQTRGAYKSWAQVFLKEFEELQHLAAQQQPSLMDHYGATNPAEFFAVATETFFECPQQMHRNHGELYRELVKFYQVDPTEWI
ncbi:MAG TPA: zinc-dependent peptidase [Porticoccaceae bacterium]|jgi:Mlc titration factor MtfA (ptsG expression regulator)|nr:zinc-dependent peptidase [Porticoccaceae bacterium]|tara:strand:+ start:120 stop:950 length:831 start_codon:yes stop_codon:yes gene_type:complete